MYGRVVMGTSDFGEAPTCTLVQFSVRVCHLNKARFSSGKCLIVGALFAEEQLPGGFPFRGSQTEASLSKQLAYLQT